MVVSCVLDLNTSHTTQRYPLWYRAQNCCYTQHMARQRPRVGTRFVIQGNGVGTAIKRIQQQVDTRVYGTRLTAADEIVKALRSPSRSRVNVDTVSYTHLTLPTKRIV